MVGIRGKSFAVAALADKRISLATSLYRAAMTGLLNAAKEVREHLTFGYIDNSLATPEMTPSCASRRCSSSDCRRWSGRAHRRTPAPA
jgi:hypothetical protein